MPHQSLPALRAAHRLVSGALHRGAGRLTRTLRPRAPTTTRGQALAQGLIAAAALATLLATSLLPAGPAAAQTSTAAAATSNGPARVIVKFKAGASILATHAQAMAARPEAVLDLGRAQALGGRLGLALRDGHGVAPRTQVMFADGLSSEALAAKLAADPEVEYAVPDQRRFKTAAPNDPLYLSATSPAVGQWYLRASSLSLGGATVRSAVNAEAAWAITTGSSSITVAVLDTGVRPGHPDLAGKLLPGYDFISSATIANDGDGRDADPSDPGDSLTSAEITNGGATFSGCTAENSSWHGTQTAGLVGAMTGNGTGMSSLGRNVMVLPLRVLGKCGGFDSDIMAAMQWAAGISVGGVPDNPNPARVINMSLGSPASCSGGVGTTAEAYRNVLASLVARNVAVFVSAGNDGLAVSMPANCAGALAVGGLRHAGTKSGFSDLGPEVFISAPGGNCVNTAGACIYPILSTSNSGVTSPANDNYTTGGGDAAVGTSFSAPLVSATAALLLSANPSLTLAQLKTLLTSTARAFPNSATTGIANCLPPSATAQDECTCTTSTCGAGMLDAGGALAAAATAVVVPSIVATNNAPTGAGDITLTAQTTTPPAGVTIQSYQWDIVAASSDAGVGSFKTISAGGVVGSATTVAGNTATLTMTGKVGSVTVQLTVVDSAGIRTVSQRFSLPGATVTPLPSSSKGGGALTPVWLLGLLMAIGALWWTSRGAGRARSAR